MAKSIVPFIRAQFPEYLLETNSLFPDFMEAYYEWASLQGNFQAETYALEDIPSIDKSYELFRDEFIAEYLDGLPANILVDKKLLIKKVTELYSAKGTPKAIQFLIRIISNADAEIFYPSTQIFKPSAAQWNRHVVIRFVLATGLLTSFENIQGSITTANKTYQVSISKIDKVENTVNVFEAILDITSSIVDIPNTGGILTTPTFTANLVKSVSKKSIRKYGSGFSLGELYSINNGTGLGTIIKVTKVDASSGLRGFDIIEFGNGYQTSFIKHLPAKMYTEAVRPTNLNISLLSADVPYFNYADVADNSVNYIQDNFIATKFDYVIDNSYFEDNTYVGEVQSAVTTDTISVVSISSSYAEIYFELGFIFEYPGYYSTNVGFLDDASYIQDGEYHQQYSYVVKSDVQPKDYITPLTKLLHPAGLKLFGQYNIYNSMNIIMDIRNRINKLTVTVNDEILMQDVIDSKILMKVLTDQITFLETQIKEITKIIPEDLVYASESIAKDTYKVLAEILTTFDEELKSISKVINDTITLSDSHEKSTDKTINDTATSSSSGYGIVGPYYYELVDYSLYWAVGYAENEVVF